MSPPLPVQIIQKFAATLTLTLILPLIPIIFVFGGASLFLAIMSYTLGSASLRVLWPKAPA